MQAYWFMLSPSLCTHAVYIYTTLDLGNLDQIHAASVMNSMCSCQQQKISQRKRKSNKNLNDIIEKLKKVTRC